MNTSLGFRDSEGTPRVLKNCSMRVDNAGRYWMWSDDLGINIAIKALTREDCLLQAISSLLFNSQMQAKKIEKLERIEALAQALADQIQADS